MTCSIAGVNCGVLGEAYCGNGRTIFGFVVGGLTFFVLGLMYLVVNKDFTFGSLGKEKSFISLAGILGKLSHAALVVITKGA